MASLCRPRRLAAARISSTQATLLTTSTAPRSRHRPWSSGSWIIVSTIIGIRRAAVRSAPIRSAPFPSGNLMSMIAALRVSVVSSLRFLLGTKAQERAATANKGEGRYREHDPVQKRTGQRHQGQPARVGQNLSTRYARSCRGSSNGSCVVIHVYQLLCTLKIAAYSAYTRY